MEKYSAIGLMSGTSLDGIDIAACEFILENNKWSFNILSCHTYPYSAEWKEKLIRLPAADALTFLYADNAYGHFLGTLARTFMEETGFMPDIIASHGHTIFHQPGKGLTVQIGSGSAIAAETGLPVICDFRSADVALGGQGAPLVPVGDRLLFPDFDACLNLGGFANISMESGGERIAFDVCPVNIILNRLVNSLGLNYDKDGEIARTGRVNTGLLERLNRLEFYSQNGPKSLGREWLEHEFIPQAEMFSLPVNDLLNTICEHIALQINLALRSEIPVKVLVTGGGAYHRYLLDRIRFHGDHQWILPANEWIDFKEALVFAFLGILRWRGEINILRSVTGGRTDHCGGAIYQIL
ncbi:MAG: anhydro-N-acetylmuramic acid kinase [Bacteroidales bacterium]|nr:anhydro-N-acetylmuramic acid kinase [Bacteroidales bacterium]